MTDVEQPTCHHTRQELLDHLATRRDHTRVPTPRIDTMRNRAHATIELIAMVVEELGDLQVLAYDRQAARAEVTVSGGDRDYALDTNGDMRARAAYRALGLALLDTIDILGPAAHDVLKSLRTGERSGRGRRLIGTEELASAIGHQARRAAAGDYTPVAREPQPEAAEAAALVEEITKERDEAVRRAARATRLIERVAGVEPRVWLEERGDVCCYFCGAVNPTRLKHHAEDCMWRLARARMSNAKQTT